MQIVSGKLKPGDKLSSVRDLAMEYGVNPNTKEQLIPLRVVKLVRSLMVTCGMYDYSGEYAATVGMPSKSGVGGGIIAAPIGKCGIAAYGPALDEKGNSVGGLKIMEFLSEKMDLHMF